MTSSRGAAPSPSDHDCHDHHSPSLPILTHTLIPVDRSIYADAAPDATQRGQPLSEAQKAELRGLGYELELHALKDRLRC